MSSALLAKIDAIILGQREGDKWTHYSENHLTKRGAALYVKQHGIFTRHSRRAWAYVVANCPETEVRRFIVKENLYEEEGTEEQSHYVKLSKMAKVIGVTQEEMDSAKPLPSTRASLLIWETLTKDRHWLIGAAAKATLEYKTTPGAEARRWRDKLSLTAEDVYWWTMHHEIDAIHGIGGFDLTLKYLELVPQVSDEEIVEAVSDSIFAWRLFKDGIAAAALQGDDVQDVA